MRDDCEQAILHIVGETDQETSVKTVLKVLNEVFPGREIRRRIRILIERGEMEFGENLGLQIRETKENDL